MSDKIPFDIQAEIIKRVPVKTLLQLRSVSKEWRSVIDSPGFADDYCLRHSQPHRLLIRYHSYDTFISKYKYVSVADDDTLHQHQFPTASLPKSVNNGMVSTIVGCAHGLFCFYGFDPDHINMVVLWNPSIRKSVDVPVPNVQYREYQNILGFGVSPQTKDPKIVKINSFQSFDSGIDTSVPIPWRVEVFTLSSGTWKTPSCSGNCLPCRDSIIFQWSQVVLDGVIYGLAFERIEVDGKFRTHNLIMSFDLSSEGFEEVCLPDNLSHCDNYNLSISKRMESVVVLVMDETGTFYNVWMMGQGVTKSFTKLFNIMPRVSSNYVVCGFMKNGEPIVDHESHALFVYESDSGAIKDLGIVGHHVCCSVKSYMETLLLIDQ